MKKALCCALTALLLIVPSVSLAQTNADDPPEGERYPDGLKKGREYARETYPPESWFLGGLLGGAALGFIGAGVVTGLSQAGTTEILPEDQHMLTGHGERYQAGFQKGYDQVSKRKALKASAIGGLIGTAVIMTIVLSAQSD